MYADRTSPVVIGGDYITTETGTGLVHTAPGHGQEDYVTGLKFGLPLLSPVDDAGNFTQEAGALLVGKNVLSDGNLACIALLRETDGLLLQESYPHKYPYDWRTKKPTIFRATSQWFASVAGFRDEALAALDGIEFIPASGAKRMRPMVSGRNDWCISRQRAWGVPIPCFYDTETKVELMDEGTAADRAFPNPGTRRFVSNAPVTVSGPITGDCSDRLPLPVDQAIVQYTSNTHSDYPSLLSTHRPIHVQHTPDTNGLTLCFTRRKRSFRT
tara:strand:- start:116 stop:928 length:813 start_codon:yes stop_codon:yes gene_type:complete